MDSIVNIGAMGYQKDIARKVVEEKKSKYILSLKENNLLSHEEIAEYFNMVEKKVLKIQTLDIVTH